MSNYPLATEAYLDDGYSNDLQRLFALSRSEVRVPREQAKAQALAEEGRFVVVEESTVFCPQTDAILGAAFRVLADFETREEAVSFVVENGFGEDCGDPDFSGPYLYEPYRIIPAPATGEDELPF